MCNTKVPFDRCFTTSIIFQTFVEDIEENLGFPNIFLLTKLLVSKFPIYALTFLGTVSQLSYVGKNMSRTTSLLNIQVTCSYPTNGAIFFGYLGTPFISTEASGYILWKHVLKPVLLQTMVLHLFPQLLQHIVVVLVNRAWKGFKKIGIQSDRHSKFSQCHARKPALNLSIYR